MLKKKKSDVFADIEQQNLVFGNPATLHPKDITVDYCKNNEYEPSNIAMEDLSVEVTALKLLEKL